MNDKLESRDKNVMNIANYANMFAAYGLLIAGIAGMITEKTIVPFLLGGIGFGLFSLIDTLSANNENESKQ